MSRLTKPHKDVYQIITDRILESLDKGVVPWHKPWRGGSQGQPKSLSTRKPYRGINVWLLSMAAQDAGYTSPYWVTYKKAQELGGQVRKGAKSTVVVFWKHIEKEKTTDSGSIVKDDIWFLRYFNVFNIDQCENLNPDKLPIDASPDADEKELEFEPIEYCEYIITNMQKRPEIVHDNERRAYYRPSTDTVHLPDRKHFDNESGYYQVMFHELGHSTGSENRLGRKDFNGGSFGTHDYGKEELVAEFCASMLCGVCGIENDTIERSASYIDNWKRAIKGDKKLVIQAASAGQKAADYIRNI